MLLNQVAEGGFSAIAASFNSEFDAVLPSIMETSIVRGTLKGRAVFGVSRLNESLCCFAALQDAL